MVKLGNSERKRKKCKKRGKEECGEGEGIGGTRERICSGGEMLSSRRGFHTISTVGTDSSSYKQSTFHVISEDHFLNHMNSVRKDFQGLMDILSAL